MPREHPDLMARSLEAGHRRPEGGQISRAKMTEAAPTLRSSRCKALVAERGWAEMQGGRRRKGLERRTPGLKCQMTGPRTARSHGRVLNKRKVVGRASARTDR